MPATSTARTGLSSSSTAAAMTTSSVRRTGSYRRGAPPTASRAYLSASVRASCAATDGASHRRPRAGSASGRSARPLEQEEPVGALAKQLDGRLEQTVVVVGTALGEPAREPPQRLEIVIRLPDRSFARRRHARAIPLPRAKKHAALRRF